MKRFLPLIGLTALLLPAATLAAGDRYADLAPVSPFVELVVRRVRQGLASGATAGEPAAKFTLQSWWDTVTGVILGAIDTDLRIVEQERDLIANAPCLRIDTLILEGWMERARLRKNAALKSGDVVEASRLISMQFYLNDRFKALVRGARDPAFEDVEEGAIFSFDPEPYWCCPGVEEEGKAPQCKSVGGAAALECTRRSGSLSKRHFSCVNAGCDAAQGEPSPEEKSAPCPFDTDYLPPVASGYGCDLSVLDRYTEAPEGIAEEKEGMKTLVVARDRLIAGMSAAKDAIELLERRLGGGTPDLANFGAGASDKRTHKRISGCLAEDRELPDDVALWESRGPFSFVKQDTVLLPKLASLWRGWGELRLAPEYLRVSRLLPSGSAGQKFMQEWERSLGGLFFLSARDRSNDYLSRVSRRQADAESLVLAQSLDAPERVLQSLAPLRTEVRALALAVMSSDTGIRKFVRDFAAYLRVSCVLRPCNEQLDRVLRIVYEDACFPYVRGAALEDDTAQACKSAAGL